MKRRAFFEGRRVRPRSEFELLQAAIKAIDIFVAFLYVLLMAALLAGAYCLINY